MGRSSQIHKLDIHGSNSLSERKALAVVRQQHGSDTVAATLLLDGLWSGTDTITVTVNIGGGDLTPSYSPAGNEDAVAAASGLATQVTAETGVTATSTGTTVYVTKTTAGTVDIVSAVIT
jgi:hypothetical protein